MPTSTTSPTANERTKAMSTDLENRMRTLLNGPFCSLGPRLPKLRDFSSPSLSVILLEGGAGGARNGPLQTEDVFILHARRGMHQVLHSAGTARLEPGEFVAFRGSLPIEAQSVGSFELMGLRFPRSMLEQHLPDWRRTEFMPLPARAEAALCFDMAQGVLENGPGLQAGSVDLMSQTLGGLLARALAARPAPQAEPAADSADVHRQRVRDYCRKHLDDELLSAEQIAAATGLSRSHLHRLFSGEASTLMAWLQAERLEACHRLIVATAGRRLTLTDIALGHGFKCPAHFSRAFRRRYGIAPSELRRRRTAMP